MKNEVVTPEIALSLKEVGFNEPCIFGYNDYNALKANIAITNADTDDKISNNRFYSNLKAPLWQQVIEWFRNLHHIYIWISYSKGYDNPYSGYIIILNKTNGITTGYSKSYEESRKRVILKAIELCKNNSELTE